VPRRRSPPLGNASGLDSTDNLHLSDIESRERTGHAADGLTPDSSDCSERNHDIRTRVAAKSFEMNVRRNLRQLIIAMPLLAQPCESIPANTALDAIPVRDVGP
jgi:hypothetical protein